jgi:hypothetical protein
MKYLTFYNNTHLYCAEGLNNTKQSFITLDSGLLSFLSLGIYIGCTTLFFYLMMDIWNKFQSKATTKSVSYRSEPAMPLPCFTLHHQQPFKEHGKVVIHDRRDDVLLVWLQKSLIIHSPIHFRE